MRLLDSCYLCAVSGEIAGWHKDDLPWLLIAEEPPDLALVLRRGDTHGALKFRTERAQAGIADFEANFGDRHFTGSKQMASVVHATAGKENMRGLAESRVEQAMEMKRRETGFAGSSIQKDLRLVAGGQKIARTTEPAKSFVIH